MVPQPRKVEVQVVQGPDAGKRIRAEGEYVTVGTASSNSLVLSDPEIADQHIKLAIENGGVLVVDMGSRTGTMVGTVRVHRAVVPVGSAIRIGATTLRALVGSSDDSVEETVYDDAPDSAEATRKLSDRSQQETALDEPALRPASDIRMLGEDLGDNIFDLPYREARGQVLGVFEAKFLQRLLEKTRGNVSAAAREAKMDRSYLIKLLKKHRSA